MSLQWSGLFRPSIEDPELYLDAIESYDLFGDIDLNDNEAMTMTDGNSIVALLVLVWYC